MSRRPTRKNLLCSRFVLGRRPPAVAIPASSVPPQVAVELAAVNRASWASSRVTTTRKNGVAGRKAGGKNRREPRRGQRRNFLRAIAFPDRQSVCLVGYVSGEVRMAGKCLGCVKAPREGKQAKQEPYRPYTYYERVPRAASKAVCADPDRTGLQEHGKRAPAALHSPIGTCRPRLVLPSARLAKSSQRDAWGIANRARGGQREGDR